MASQEQHAELLARINFELENYGKITEQTQNDLIDARVGVKDFERMVAGPALQAVSSLGTAIGRTAGNIYRADKGLQRRCQAAPLGVQVQHQQRDHRHHQCPAKGKQGDRKHGP